MTIIDIIEIKNPNQKDMKPIREKQDIYIPDIVDQNISRRNGMIYLMSGSGGSCKSSLSLNMFKNKDIGFYNLIGNLVDTTNSPYGLTSNAVVNLQTQQCVIYVLTFVIKCKFC